MSQVFSADSVNNTGTTSIPTTTTTVLVTGNFLNPPFGNAKAVVTATAQIATGTGTTTINLAIRRNPNAENALVASVSNIQATVGNNVMYTMAGADVIPDGRPVQYAMTVVQTGATGNGNAYYANVSAMLISG